jgi:carbon starvation protein CstA
MGLVEKVLKPKLWLQTIIFVPATLGVVWLGTRLSTLVTLGPTTWGLLILAYCFVASLTPVWLLLQPPAGIPGWSTKAGLALVVIIWGVTFLVSVPCHATLSAGFDASAHDRLVSTNWIRTIGWTARAALSVWMLWQALELKKA